MTTMTTSSSFRTRFGLLLTCLLSFLHFTTAQSPASSTYTHGGGPMNLSVSINVPDNSSDTLYFRFNGPASNSWVAFGFGGSMSGSLMFVAYENQGRDGVTVSPRLGDGHVMPEHTDSVKVTLLEGSGLVNNIFSVNAMCTGCRSWDGGSLNVKSTSQSMIMAIGPAWSLATDDLNAPIRQHQVFDTFNLNLVEATGTAGVPLISGSTSSGSTSDDNDDDDDVGGPPGWRAPSKVVAHALLMIAAFLILFPGGYLVLRVFEKVLAHAAVQAVAMLFVIISTALGVSISKGMKIHPDLTHPHQILGFLILVLVLASFAIGAAGHAMFRKTGQPAKFMIGHRVLGPLTITLGLINVCVGFNFAGNNRPIIAFVVVTVLMILFVTGVVLMVRRRRMRKGAMNTPAAMNFREGQQAGPGGPPPAYPVATGTSGGPAIPLQTYQPTGAVYR